MKDDRHRSREDINPVNDPRFGQNIRRKNPMSLRTTYWKGLVGHPRAGYPSRVIASGKVDTRLPGKGNSNSHGARPV